MIQGMIDYRHDDMSYYDLQQALPILQANLPPPFDLLQLADLCSREVITPVVFYDRCLDKVDIGEIIYSCPPIVYPFCFEGLITSDKLNGFIHKYISDNSYQVRIEYARIYEQYTAYHTWDTDREFKSQLQTGDTVALFNGEAWYDDQQPRTTHDQGEDDVLTVSINDLRFPVEQVDAYIATYGKHANKSQASQPIDTTNALDKINAERKEFIATGKAIAAYLWGMDTEKAIRTGDMVQQLKTILYNINPNLVPQDKTLAGWLADIAPDYAMQAGRPIKNLPNEISLTMKR